LKVSDVFKLSKFIQEMFKNEFLPQLEGDLTLSQVEKVMLIAKRDKMVLFDQETGSLKKSMDLQGYSKTQFKKDLLLNFIDSYLMALLTLNIMVDLGTNIEQKRLTCELHHAIKSMYKSGYIRFMNSCLQEVLDTAFGRFAELGLCTKNVYTSQYSQQMIYIQVSSDHREQI